MDKLTIKELAPYLPYKVRIKYNNGETSTLTQELMRDTAGFLNSLINVFKPILRPLSDLKQHECYTALSDNLRFNIDILGFPNYLDLKVNDYNILLENHFDVFGLIEKFLSVDINTLNERDIV